MWGYQLVLFKDEYMLDFYETLLQKCTIATGPCFIIVMGIGWPDVTVVCSHICP
jgi:hypothetical protein